MGERQLVDLAGMAMALVLAVWLVTGVVLALQAASCRLAGAARGQPVDYRVPGGCYVRDAAGDWAPLPAASRGFPGW